MTYQEAIEWQEAFKKTYETTSEDAIVACQMAIDALKDAYYNQENRNTGYWNTGSFNVGNRNTGNFNTGDWNTGNNNTGYCNTGNNNIGDYNTGDWNKSSFNTGCFITEELKICLFNKLSDWTYIDWIFSDACSLLNNMPKCVQAWWDGLSSDKQDIIRAIPNFDADIFKECTGIDVRKFTIE